MPSAQRCIMDDVLGVIYPACLLCAYLITVPPLHKEKAYDRFIHLFISVLCSAPCWKRFRLTSTSFSFVWFVNARWISFAQTLVGIAFLPHRLPVTGRRHYAGFCLQGSSRNFGVEERASKVWVTVVFPFKIRKDTVLKPFKPYVSSCLYLWRLYIDLIRNR